MTGGDGSDIFAWTDQFIVGETDTITDFDDEGDFDETGYRRRSSIASSNLTR